MTQCWLVALVVVLALAGSAKSAFAKGNRTATASRPPPPLPPYQTMWATAARGAFDRACNSTLPGACYRLIGSPKKEALGRKECKPEAALSWVPTIKEPRSVDVRFEEGKAALVANRVSGMQVLVLNSGSLDPPISSIELMLLPRDASDHTPVIIYQGKQGDVLICPGVNTFNLPPGALQPADRAALLDAVVLGLRINVTGGPVDKKGGLPSISAVSLLVKPAAAE